MPSALIKILALACVAAALCGRVIAAADYGIKDLKNPNNGADYIVIAPGSFFEELAPLLDLRTTRGMRVAAITPQQIYGEFSRWPAGPKALRAFVRYAYFHWQAPAPKYLLLAGDIDTLEAFDPAADVIPTFLVSTNTDGRTWAAADTPFGDVDGDEIPDVAVGRLPADTRGEAAAMVQKILAYETAPPPGPWRRRVAAFASTGGFGPFDATLEELTRRIIKNNFDPAFDISMTYAGPGLPYFLLPEEFGQRVIDRFNEGALFISYIGHGSVDGVKGVCYRGQCGNILEMESIPQMNPQGRSAIFFSICCLTGKFNIFQDSIAEELIKSPGGPVGVLAGSETTGPYNNALLSKDILYFFMQKRPAAVGDGHGRASISSRPMTDSRSMTSSATTENTTRRITRTTGTAPTTTTAGTAASKVRATTRR